PVMTTALPSSGRSDPSVMPMLLSRSVRRPPEQAARLGRAVEQAVDPPRHLPAVPGAHQLPAVGADALGPPAGAVAHEDAGMAGRGGAVAADLDRRRREDMAAAAVHVGAVAVQIDEGAEPAGAPQRLP